MPNRIQLQELSEVRLRAIKSSFDCGFYDIVVADAGYPVEFGLKSAVCKFLNQESYPDDLKYKTHKLDKLVKFANLENNLKNRKFLDKEFFVNWSLISKWSVEFRYEPVGKNKKDNAQQYINAIESDKGGVIHWVKANW